MHDKIQIDQKFLTNTLLVLIGGGLATFAAICAPNALQLLRPLLQNERGRNHRERARIKEALERLAKRRLIELHQKGNTLFIEITEHGKKRLKEFDFENIILQRNTKWDKKWRIVIFDIPEEHKTARNIFQAKLKGLGFYQLQKSVWVFPFDCRDEIDFMASFCEIKPFFLYFETSDLGYKEGTVRKFFHLL